MGNPYATINDYQPPELAEAAALAPPEEAPPWLKTLPVHGRGSFIAVAAVRDDGVICLRVDDINHPEFWVHIHLDAAALAELLAQAGATKKGGRDGQ